MGRAVLALGDRPLPRIDYDEMAFIAMGATKE
jgi:hypothetical protein